MPRSSKDDDEEPRSGRIYTRKVAAQSVVDSPLRRSSRIRQTMESTSIETLKGTRYTRRTSFSSDINDTPDVEIGTSRRTTRRSGTITFSPSTRVTRTLNKRLTRAGSETKSPSVSPSLRRCRTRASSVDIESASVQNQYESDIPLKLHKQVTMLPSCSSLKDGEEKKLMYLNDIIPETEEYTNIENIDSSSSQILHMDKKDKKESLDTKEYNSEECLPHDAIIADEDTPDKSSSPLKKEKNDKIDNKISELSEVQVSLIDICKTEKELGVKMENMLNISIEEEKRSPSNKENQTLNIINSTVMKSIQSITTLPSSSTDSLTSFASISKTLNEKENKSVLNEVSLGKKLHDSTEAAIKHSTLSKDIDSNEEKTDISINSLSLNLTDSKSDLDNSLKSVTSEKQSSNHDVNGESSVDNTNKLLLLEDNIVDVIDESIVAKETSIENKSEFFEDTIDTVEASNKKDEDSKKSSVTETYKMSHLSINQIPDKCDSTASLILIQSLNTKVVEERRPCPSENKVLSIVDQSIADHTKQLNTNDAEILPLNDKSSEDNQSTILQSIVSQIDVNDNDNFLKQKQQMLHEQLDYSAFPEINSSSKNLNEDSAIQDNQSLDVSKTSVKSVTEIAKDNSDVDIGIELFQDVPAETWEKKIAKRNNKVGSQLPKNLGTQPECDLVLIDKQAWFETKNEETKQELLEYDSDDIFKNRSEAANVSFSDAKNSSISNQKMYLNEKTKTIKLNKKKKLLTKRKSVSQEDKNSSNEREKEEDSLNIFNTSSEPETEELDQCKDQVVLKLTRSEQVNTILQTQFFQEQTSGKHDTSNEEKEDDDAGRLHRSLPASKKVTLLRKSMEKRKSLNKSVKDTSLKQSNVQEVNQSQIDVSEEDLDNISTHIRKKTKKKHSLNKSNNMDAYNNTVTEREKISPSKDNIEEDEDALINHSVNKKLKSSDTNNISVNTNDEINDVNIICTIDLGFKNILAKSLSDLTDSSNSSENVIPQFLFSQSSEDDSNNSIDLDIKKEYNLSGVKQELPDDILADECRDSEEEFSDPDDHGSDLVDFIVDDSNDNMESEKIEEENNEDVEEEGIENEDEQYIIEDNEVEEKEAEDDQRACKNIEYCTESDNKEDADEENDEVENKYKNNPAEIMKITDVIEKSKINKKKKSKRQSIETISPNDSKIKQNVKITKSPVNKTEETLIKQINTIEPKKFKSPVAILGCSTSNLNLQNKNPQIVVPELQSNNCNSSNINKRITFLDIETNDQNVKKDLKNKYIKLDKTDKSTQDTSAKKQESKISVKRDIKLEESSQQIQESSQQKQRKRKRQNEIWDKDAADELVVQDANELNELNVLKKKKRVKIDSMSNTKNTTCEYSCYVKGKEKNQKHKDDKIANNSETNSDDNYMHVMKQIMCKKTEEKKDILPKQLSQKKKKKENSSSLQTRVLKLKSENLESNKVRKSELEPTSSKVQNKRDFSANYKILKKIKCQKIAENKETLSEQLLGKKKKNIKSNTLLLQPRVIKSDILKSDKHGSKLADSTETQNEETNSSTDNYMAMKKKQKERKTVNSKEPLLKKLKKKKKAKKILSSEIGISTLKEQETVDNKDTSEMLLKKKKKAKQILLLESEISLLQSDNFQLKELQLQNYNKSDLAASLKTQDKKQDLSILSYEDMYKKLKRQKRVESREYLAKKLSEKKRKKEEASALKSKVPKIKPGKLLSHDMSYTDESISTLEVRDKALRDIHATDMHITANEELKKKVRKRKLEDIEINVDQDKNKKSAKKKRKEEKVKENNCLSSSTETLKQLPDSMIMDLANMPMKKKRKLSQNEKHLGKNIGKSMTATGENSIPSSSCSNISGFTVVNLENTKKQQSSKRVATIISARQHISTKNREPVSAYISYLQKQRATSKNKFTSNAF